MKKYDADDRLCDIISDNPLILMAMSRFGISLGFGDKSVVEICRQQGVDTATFMTVVNFISCGDTGSSNISIASLINYLDNAHAYFLDYCLPMIRSKLIDAIDLNTKNKLSLVLLNFYDEYVEEVHRHMDYESTDVFGYVRGLLAGKRPERFSIDVFAQHHHGIHDKLKELENIIVRYLPQKDSHLLNSVLFDIINCEQDLMTHCSVEDKIFVPAVRRLENEIQMNKASEAALNEVAETEQEATISSRERDIIANVARGLSNKEIANKLCISINTVTTHRRNIAQKLQIHSAAGLTVYAVINGILTIEDIS